MSVSAQRTAGSQTSSLSREDAGDDAELQSEGYASFVGGGMIASKTANGKGEQGQQAAVVAEDGGESDDV